MLNPKQLLNQAMQAYRDNNIKHAIKLLETYLQQSSDDISARNNLAVMYKQLGKFQQALQHYKIVHAAKPNNAGYSSNYANVLRQLGDYQQALKLQQFAVKADPNNPQLHYNLGLVLRDLGQYQQALKQFDIVIKQQPDYHYAHWDKALTLLVSGDLQQGFIEYEARFNLSESEVQTYNLPIPRWQGEALQNKSILIIHEQGYGDTIQFCRYAELLKNQGADVTLLCQPPLKDLLTNSLSNTIQVQADIKQIKPTDYYQYLLSLPQYFKTDLKNIPKNIPYLYPRQTKQQPEALQKAINNIKENPKFKIGLVWAGKPTHKNDHMRSLQLTDLAPIYQRQDIACYSFQVGVHAEQVQTLNLESSITDLTPLIQDFQASADLVSSMDLIISADTAMAHLAGALGQTTWVLLPKVPDWRWLDHIDTNPWYETLTLFRQSAACDWLSAINSLNDQLDLLLNNNA